MRKPMKWGLAAMLACGAASAVAAERISIKDYCDPSDPGWAPTGGCLLKEGDVTFAEFNALLTSMFSTAVVGHPAWRFQPSFVESDPDGSIRVTNDGGRQHTFTEVAAFGGGFVPPLNIGLVEAPECANATVISPGERVVIRGLAEGDHKFQCCIHPWMRALVKVEEENGN
jgi:plastocyanin